MSAILECTNLAKNYGAKQALCDFTLRLEPGQIVGLVGPNGSGKTTLIKLINGLLQPTSGSVLIDGLRPGVESKKVVAYLPDRNIISEQMRVRDVLNFFGDFYPDFNRQKAENMLKDLNIDISKRFKSLSKGMQEKVQLAMVMAREAKLYILDEPIAGVDPAARDYIIKTILNNYNPQATLLIATHLIADVEQIFDAVVFLENGHIRLYDTVDNLRIKYGQSVDQLFREVYKC